MYASLAALYYHIVQRQRRLKQTGYFIHLSAARERGRSGTRYLLPSMAPEDRIRYSGSTGYDISISRSPRLPLDSLGAYLQALVVFLLLLVYYSQSEIDFVGLLKIWLHPHHL